MHCTKAARYALSWSALVRVEQRICSRPSARSLCSELFRRQKRISNEARYRLLRRGRGIRVLEEEPQHLPRGVRPSRIGIGASGAAARPGVSGTMDLPVLKDCPPARVGMDGAGIGMSSGYPTATHGPSQVRSPLLRNNTIAVARMHCVVSIPMKNDGRDSRPVLQDRRNIAEPGRSRQATLPHGGERSPHVGRAAGHPDLRA
jgi:hypothetical protein